MTENDTIAAIASGITNSGISVIRISGPGSFSVIQKIFHTKEQLNWNREESHTVHYGFIFDEEEAIDEVLVLFFYAPKTYTREDVVEIDCHGGAVITRRVLETVLKNGARLAEPGEFTKRAFLNGRIDLSQAEAVADIINATNKLAAKHSVTQLRGKLAERITAIRTVLLDDLSYIEAALDDPEHISVDEYRETLEQHLFEVSEKVKKLIGTYENGKLIREGIDTVILGRPNAGKSTLLNLFAGEERAIVTEIAGTTRDLLEVPVLLNGLQLNITDTAGLRDTTDVVEKIGVERALEKSQNADLILYLLDAGKKPEPEELKFIQEQREQKILVLLNKSDLQERIRAEELKKSCQIEAIEISAQQDLGTEQLKEAICEMFSLGTAEDSEMLYLANERQKQALLEAEQALDHAVASIRDGMPEDFISIDITGAYQALGKILGETMEEDLVNNIFEKFCMGK